MKPILFLICAVALFAPYAMSAQSDSIHFKRNVTLAQAQAELRSEHKKMILIDCYTERCPPCKWMDKNIFTDSTVASFCNSNFICLKVEMILDSATRLGRMLHSDTCGVGAYPTYVFFDSLGKIRYHSTGTTAMFDTINGDPYPHGFINICDSALDPHMQEYIALKDAFFAGTITMPQLKWYLYICKYRENLHLNSQADYCFRTGSDSLVTDSFAWRVLNTYVWRLDSKAGQYLLSHRSEYNQAYGIDSVNKTIRSIYKQSNYHLYTLYTDTTGYWNRRRVFINLGFDSESQMILIDDLQYYSFGGRWEAYASVMNLDIKRYGAHDWSQLASAAELFAEIPEIMLVPVHRDSAFAWIHRSIDLHPCFQNADIYSEVLLADGQRDKALAEAQKALILAKEEQIPDYLTAKTQRRIDEILGK